MADFFKSAAQAGTEVRRKGQLSPDDDRDPFLTELGKVASEGSQIVTPPTPRRGIAAPTPDTADSILANYLTDAAKEPDRAELILRNYLGADAQAQPAPAQPQSEGGVLGDVIGRPLARGVVGLGGSAYEIGNLVTQGGLDTVTKKAFGTSGTEALSSVRQSLNSQDSVELQRQRAELDKADGFWDSMGTVLTNPRLMGSMVFEMVPQMATVIGAAKVVATKTLASQLAQGAAKDVAEKAAQRAATMTVMGVNPALEASSASSDVRSTIMQMAEKDLQASPQYQALLAQGVNPEDARGRLANDAANFAAIVSAPISAASNSLTAKFEAKLATGQVGKQFGLKALAKEVGEGLIKEPIQEGIEEGGSQLGQNVGMQQAVNPNQDLLAGVPQAAGAGAALGAVAGVGFGAANARFGTLKDPNRKSDTPASPDSPQPPGGGSGTADRPTNLELTENQFNASLQSPRIVPFLTYLWANSDEMTQTRIQELARRSNIMTDFAQESENSEVLGRGAELVRQSGGQFVTSFLNTMNRELVKPDVTPLPPKTPEKTPVQLQQEYEANQGFDVAENAIASAEALGIQPRTQKGNDRAQTGNVPEPNVLLRGYQRRAENLQSQPLAARRAAATSSITEMIGRGFSAEQAQAIFGPLMQETPNATPDTQGSAPNVSPVLPVIQNTQETAPAAEAVVEPAPEPAPAPAPTPAAAATPQQFKSARFADNSYEVSSQGDKRFSAFNARLSDGRTIEEAYQLDVKGYREKGGTSWRDGKGKPAVNGKTQEQLYAEYLALWQQWARENPGLVEELRQEAVGKTLTDKFATGPVNQARALADILNGNTGTSVEAAPPQQAVTEPVTNVTEEASAPVLQEKTTVPDQRTETTDQAVRDEYTRLFSEQAQATAELPTAERVARLQSLAKDMQELGFTKEEAASTLRGTREEVGSDGTSRKVQFGLDIDEQPAKPSAAKPESEVFEGGNPDVMVGTTKAPPPERSADILAKEEMVRENARRLAMRRAAAKGLDFNQFLALVDKDGKFAEAKRAFTGMRRGDIESRYEATKATMPKAVPEKKSTPTPRQGNIGEDTVAKEVVSRFRRRANEVMSSLVKKISVEDQISALDAMINQIRKKQPLDRSQSEYIFGHFADAGALNEQDTDDARAKEKIQRLIRTIEDKKEKLRADNIAARAEAIRQNMQQVAAEFSALRSEMEEAGVPKNIIDDILLEKEIGVRNILEGADSQISAEQQSMLAELLDSLNFAEVAESAKDKAVTVESIIRNARRSADPRQYVRSQLSSFGFEDAVLDKVDDILSVKDDGLSAEKSAPVNEEIFGEAAQAAAQVVDALGNEVNTPRALAILKAEASAANVGNLDIYNEMRLRGMEIPQEMISFASRPGIRYTLDFWMKKNDGRDAYTVRDEWLGSIDQTLRDLEGRKADQDEILNSLSPEESKLLKDWRKQRADLRTRLAEHVKSDGANEYAFDNLDNAFPHALFNKYPLSSMFDVTKLPDADRPALLALAGGSADALPSIWYSDVHTVLSARPDLEGQVQETLSDEEYAKYNEWRNRQIRMELANAKMIAQSPAFSQLFQLQTLLDPEAYESFRSQIAVAQQNQVPAILQAAYELAEQQRAAGKTNVDQATEAVMDAVYAQDETHLSAIDADAVPDTEGELNQNNEQMADEGAEPDKILDQLKDIRFKRGRYSGVTVAAEIFGHLNKIVSGWNRAPKFQVLNSINQLPEDLREQALEKLGTQSAKGMMGPDGQVYIFSDFIENLEDAEFVFFHEIYGHHGLRAFLGDKLNGFLDAQYKTNQRVREAADKLKADAEKSGRGISTLEATEEAIADLAVNNQEPGLFVQILQALKKFFRSIGMDSVARWMDEKSHKDLAFVLSQVRKSVRLGINSPMDGAPESVRFAANQNPVEIFVTKNGKTNVYGMYNALTGNWTVFYNPNGLEASNFGIQTFDSYADALEYARQYGKVISAKDHPRRQPMGPGDFNKVSIKHTSDVTGWKAYARRAYMTFVQKHLPILEVVNQIKAQGGETNLWQAITLYRGRIKPYFDKFRRNFLRPISSALDTINKNGDKYTFDGVEYSGQDLVDLYLLALHAQERNETIQNIRPDKKDGSGLDTASANKILKDLSKTQSIKELQQISSLMRQLSKMKVNYMLATNLINEAQAAALNNYMFYVNLSGTRTDTNESVDKQMLGGRAINLRGNDVKRALGRESMPVDVLENTMNNYLGVILRGQKNIVAQSVYDMVIKNPDPTFAIVNPFAFIKKLDVDKLVADKNILRVIGEQPTVESGLEYLKQLGAEIDLDPASAPQVAGKIYRRLEEAYQQGKLSGNQFAAYSQKIENAAIRTTTTKSGEKHQVYLSPEGYVTDVLDVDKMNKENVFVVKIGGKPIAIEFMEGVDNPEMGKIGTFASALHGVNHESSSAFSEAMGAANRWIGQLITSKNLAWVPVNWMRDIGTAYFNAAADPRVGQELAKKMFKRAPESYAVAFKNLLADEYANETGPVYSFFKKMAGKPVNAETERMWNEFVNSGAQVFFMDRKDMKQQIAEMQRELNPRGGLLGTWDAYGKFADFIGIPAEASARFSAYRTLREAGWTVEDAAVYAKEITVNFEQTGSWRAIRNYFMFANPAIQGNVRMFRDMVTKTKGGVYVPSPKFMKIVGALAGFGFVMGFLARAMGDNGEDQVNDLDKIPRYKRATSVVIVPGMPMGSPLPMPYGWNVFYAMGNFAADSLFGKTPVSTTAGRVVSTAIDAFWPLGQSESGTILGTALKVFTPTLASPVLDIAMNESKFGGPIAKGDNPFVKSEEANAYKNFNSASPISVWMARGLNELAGGNEYRSGALFGARNALDKPIIPLDINPAYVDYLFASYLPGPFTDVGRLANLSINAAMGKDVKNPPVPLIDRFGSRISEGWDAGAFRTASTFLETKVAEAKAAPPEKRAEIVKEYPNLGQARDALKTIDESIRNMRSQLRAVEANPNISSREKVEARNKIQALEKEYYKRGVSMAIKAGFQPQLLSSD